jgi:hypothetical protein
MRVWDNEQARVEIKKYQLEKQYKKSCDLIREKQYRTVRLKLREPKKLGIYQFRITKKYRAFAFRDEKGLNVFHISTHQ